MKMVEPGLMVVHDGSNNVIRDRIRSYREYSPISRGNRPGELYVGLGHRLGKEKTQGEFYTSKRTWVL